MARKREPKLHGWTTKAQLILPADRGELGLAVMVDAETFAVIALEIPRVKRSASPDEAASAVFGAHAHKYIGTGTSLHAAIAIAEAYALDWLTAAPVLAACTCGEVASV